MLYLLNQLSFSKNFFTLFLSRNVLSKLFIFVAISWNFNFAVNLVTSFSRRKPLKSKNKKHRIFWNTEFHHPAKFELKRIKNAKVVTTLQLLHVSWPGLFCKISVRRSKYCLKFSITWGRLKVSSWLFYSRTIFEAFLTNSLRFSEV